MCQRIYPWRYVVTRDGGMLSYGPDLRDIVRRGATYVDQILRGAKAADLPVQVPVKWEMGVNVKTAKMLGLTVPPSIRLRARRGRRMKQNSPYARDEDETEAGSFRGLCLRLCASFQAGGLSAQSNTRKIVIGLLDAGERVEGVGRVSTAASRTRLCRGSQRQFPNSGSQRKAGGAPGFGE